MKIFTKFLAGCSTVLLLTTAVKGQTNGYDSTTRPNSFKMQVERFKSYPNSKKDIIFLGNSITAGTDWAELLQEPNAKNRGISGDITFGVLERLNEVTEGKPAKVFILIGINDLGRKIPDNVIFHNYEQIVQRIKTESPSTKIYFQSVLPTNDSFPAKNQFHKQGNIQFLNNGLKQLAAKEKFTFIDLHSRFLDNAGQLDARFTYDGLHLNPAGYLHWAKILKEGGYLK